MKLNLAISKLTGFYVLVLMVISIVFSMAIYQISSDEIGKGLGRQGQMLRGLPQRLDSHLLDDFETLKSQQMQDSLRSLKINLIYYNLLILILSSFGSYFFARWTLKPLEEAAGEQNRFTADASHELKTPLAAMRTEIEVALREKLTSEKAKKILKSNLEEIEKLQALSSALLKLSRFDEINKLEFQIVNLDEIIAEAFENVEILANKKKIEFEAKLIKSKIFGDPISLRELFIILFDNAIKYSPQGSKIKVKIVLDGKRHIVTVKDRGIGLRSLEIQHVFDRFYRADQSRNKEKADGYGLGLSIAKRIVDLHKGQISVISSPGKGSEFIVKI